MRVLTVGNRPPDPSAGGYEVVWADVVAGLRGRGHEVEVLHPPALRSYWRDGEWRSPGRLKARAIERHDERLVAAAGGDVVVWMNMGGLPMSLVRARGIAAVGVVHDGWMLYGPEKDPRCGRFAPDPDALWTFNSEFARTRTVERVALPRTEVVSPGVDPALFPFAPAGEWRGRLACIGREAPEKGIDVARAAVARLDDAMLDVVSGRPRATLHEAYAAADAVLFPVTWPEPWGLVPLEAMSVGRPVVATGTGGSAEYLRDGENCLLVPAGDAEALAAAVRRLAGDRALRAHLVAGGRATAAAHPQAAFVERLCARIESEATAGR